MSWCDNIVPDNPLWQSGCIQAMVGMCLFTVINEHAFLWSAFQPLIDHDKKLWFDISSCILVVWLFYFICLDNKHALCKMTHQIRVYKWDVVHYCRFFPNWCNTVIIRTMHMYIKETFLWSSHVTQDESGFSKICIFLLPTYMGHQDLCCAGTLIIMTSIGWQLV